MMKVLVVYSTRHGSTKGVAQEITRTLVEAGLDGRIRSMPNATGGASVTAEAGPGRSP